MAPSSAVPASCDFARPLAVLALPLAMACGGGSESPGPTGPTGPAPPTTVASVAVSPSTAELTELGATVQLEATARDQSGQALTGVSFSWSSSDQSVATVGGEGTVSAEGNGVASIRATASGVSGSADLSVRAGELAWRSVSAGLVNSCAVTTHRTLYCWGENAHGQLGEGLGNTGAPVLIEAGVTLDVVTLGGGQLCGLMADGTAYCWGNGSFGERGDGATGGFDPQPDPVTGGHQFTQISAGGNHTCGITAEGSGFCWGRNASGEVGDGTTADRLTPVPVAGDLRFVQISAGGAPVVVHTCGVTNDGAAYCWGPNGAGQLGDGTTTDRLTPVRVQSDLTLVRIAAGEQYTCALTDAGDAYCWGTNAAGELGDGTDQDSPTPVAVVGGLTFEWIGVGQHHACGLTAAGAAYCWGGNDAGQLGDGTSRLRRTPVPVTGGHSFEQLAVDGGHVCGLATDGDIYCWGLNRSAELGDGTATNRSTPVAVERPWE